MTPLAKLEPLLEVLPATGTGKARSLHWYRGLKAEGYAVDFVAVVQQQGKPEDSYAVEEFGANGGRGFYFKKPFAAGVYTCFVGRVVESCDCAAGSYGKVKRCRHLEVLAAAIGNGWL